MTDTIVEEEQPAPLSTQPDRPVEPTRGGPLVTLRWIWRVFTSMRTALLLLALLALAAIPGTVIPQRGLDPTKVATFLTDHPHLGPIMDRLRLFDVFAAWWFNLIFVLLFVSIVGCVTPRIRLHARAMRRRPPNAPRHLQRMAASTAWETDESPEAFAERVRTVLKRSHWRADVRAEPDGVVTVAAEKGYLRETGNLVFHVALLLLLVGIAASSLYGYKGTVLVDQGGSFANAQEAYDVFEPSSQFHPSQLSPFSFTLDKFTATYQANGEPLTFKADIHYKTSPTATSKPYDIEVNHPLNLPGAKVFLVGHGYSPIIKITNKAGQVVYDGQTAFLPDNSDFLSHGVVKVPHLDSAGDQLGLTGEFYPSYGISSATGSVASIFPGLKNPVLALAAWSGDLQISKGVPESDYSLSVAGLKQLGTTQLTKGQSWKLSDGGTVTFEGVDQWATFQVAHQPGKRTVLVAAVFIVLGLIGSLRVRRRRFWVRAVPAGAGGGGGGTVVTAAGLARSDVGGFVEELDDLVGQIGRPQAESAQAGAADLPQSPGQPEQPGRSGATEIERD